MRRWRPPGELTDAQAAVLDYIKEHTGAFGFQPSCAEISEHFGWASPNAASEHIRRACKKGYARTVGMRAVLDLRPLPAAGGSEFNVEE